MDIPVVPTAAITWPRATRAPARTVIDQDPVAVGPVPAGRDHHAIGPGSDRGPTSSADISPVMQLPDPGYGMAPHTERRGDRAISWARAARAGDLGGRDRTRGDAPWQQPNLGRSDQQHRVQILLAGSQPPVQAGRSRTRMSRLQPGDRVSGRHLGPDCHCRRHRLVRGTDRPVIDHQHAASRDHPGERSAAMSTPRCPEPHRTSGGSYGVTTGPATGNRPRGRPTSPRAGVARLRNTRVARTTTIRLMPSTMGSATGIGHFHWAAVDNARGRSAAVDRSHL